MTEEQKSSSGKAAPNPKRSAINRVLDGNVFPIGWRFVPVKGKATFEKNWTEAPFDSNQALLDAYHKRPGYRGVGVLTGRHSEGLIAIDIDGETADARFREAVTALGGTYEALGEESTMSWSSGRPGRRQILYVLPRDATPMLDKLKTLILRMDGKWELGQGDTERTKNGGEYEEVVLRFNGCQSVLPGSEHPDGGRYEFLNFNSGVVAPAPEWLVELVRPHYKPVPWLKEDDLRELQAEVGQTLVPSKQIRGWIFREDSEFHRLLMPRLDELVFAKAQFPEEWRDREGDPPQRLNYCPWHGGRSGTSFQYNPQNGCWDCKACAIGGDWLDFLYKIETGDIEAKKPMGPQLEAMIAELTGKLGLKYPDAALTAQTIKQEPLVTLTPTQFFEAADRIVESNENVELMHYSLARLARDCGMQWMYRNGAAVEMALDRWKRHCNHGSTVYDEAWQEKAAHMRSYLIPDFVAAPTSVMLHARGGMGKTRVALALAKVVGRGLPMRIRGAEVRPTTTGNVLLIGNDMSMTDYAEYLGQQGIYTHLNDRWLRFHSDWQQDEYKRLVRWIELYRPVMVIIDSLTSCSTEIEASENEKEYSNTMYKLARENGTSFPGTVFLWIHHNTKDGNSFRGTDTLRNAVHETWQLIELGEEERDQYPEGSLILQVDKSRANRSRARFLVEESIDEVLSISDLTPTVEHYNDGRGRAKPATVLLGLLGEADQPMTVKELKYALDARLTGERGEGVAVHRTTVLRWLERWVSKGLVEKSGVRQAGEGGGRPEATYSRVSNPGGTDPCTKPPSFFENPSSAGEEVLCNELHETTPEGDLHKTSEGCLTETLETTGVAPEVGLHSAAPKRNETGDQQSTGVPPEPEKSPSGGSAAGAEEFCAEGVSCKAMHKTSEPESSSTASDLGNEPRFCAAEGLVRGQPVQEQGKTPRWMGYRGGSLPRSDWDLDEAFPD